MDSKPIQGGGISCRWKSPDDSFHYDLTKIEFDCKIDHYPGVVIVADENFENALCSTVGNLEAELPKLLTKYGSTAIAFWRVVENKSEAKRISSSLTKHPVYVG